MNTIKNQVQLIGNIGADPEVTSNESGLKKAKFSIAVNENYTDKDGEKQEKTYWFNIVAWNKQADVIENYTKKGDKIIIKGKLVTSSYEEDEQIKRYTNVVASEILLM